MLLKHYRVVDRLTTDGVKIVVEEWIAVRETPKGYWVQSPYACLGYSFHESRKHGYLKWVSNSSVRRYCYPLITDAIHSFEIRKRRQIQKLTLQLEQATLAADGIDKIRNKDIDSFKQGVIVGMPVSLEGFDLSDC